MTVTILLFVGFLVGMVGLWVHTYYLGREAKRRRQVLNQVRATAEAELDDLTHSALDAMLQEAGLLR